MKKIAKLSFVAAVAVAGFTSANATALEEAIKGVETSGSVVYRYNDYSNDTSDTSDTTNYYKVGLNLSSKVNDDVKLNTRFLVAGADGGFATLNTQSSGDSNVDVSLSNVYFGYTGLANTTINVGKQGLTTPWTVAIDASGNEQTGTGILALTTAGPVTFAGAYFNQTNLGQSGGILKDGTTFTYLDSNKNGTWDTNEPTTGSGNDGSISSAAVATVGAIANVGPVTLDAWYIDTQDILDSYTIGAVAKFDVEGIKLGADARFTSLDLDSSNADNSLAKIVLTAKAGIVDAKLAYAMTDKEGGTVALDGDATTAIQGWSVNANGKADADYWQAVVGVDILSNLNLSANYVTMDYVSDVTASGVTYADSDVTEEEIYAQLVYKMSKNFSTYVRYGTYSKDYTATASTSKDINDDTRGRIQVAYTF